MGKLKWRKKLKQRSEEESVIDEAMQFAKEREKNGCVSARSGVGMKNGKVSKMVEPAVLFARLSPRGKTKKQFLLGLVVQAKGSCADLNRAGWENGASHSTSQYICMYNCI